MSLSPGSRLRHGGTRYLSAAQLAQDFEELFVRIKCLCEDFPTPLFDGLLLRDLLTLALRTTSDRECLSLLRSMRLTYDEPLHVADHPVDNE